jgi:SNF2 family DNA or RNA helicase
MQASIAELMLLVAKGKLKHSLEWIRNFLDLGNKLILYASHKFDIDSLEQTFQKVCNKLDGSITVFDRQEVVDDFKTNPKVRLLIADLPPTDDVI